MSDKKISKRYSTKEAVRYLQDKFGITFSPGTFEVWRSQKRGPEYLKIANRVFYAEDVLDNMAAGQTVKTVDSIYQEGLA